MAQQDIVTLESDSEQQRIKSLRCPKDIIVACRTCHMSSSMPHVLRETSRGPNYPCAVN